ncbi:MAG: HEAT repeat domain-containing protein [Cyanobacteriota bacterium]|nr:HEAT repeat domain-containing protein [Cyanobacteriota bacterium]
MFTLIWTKKYSRMTERLKSLEATREEHVFSPDLSAQTLEVAPDFWQRQQQAFSYVNQQIQKVNRRTRVWGTMALMAILADATLFVGGLMAFQAFQQYQANNSLQRLAQGDKATDPIQKTIDEIFEQLPHMDPTQRIQALQQLELLTQASQYSDIPTYGSSVFTTGAVALSPLEMQLQAISQLGDRRTLEAVPALLTKLSDGEANIRAAAAQALGNIGDLRALQSLHQRLLNEKNEMVRQSLIYAAAQLKMNGS